MSNLREFLKRQADELRASESNAQNVLKDWVASVEALLQQLLAWLREADTEKVLKIEQVEHRIRERSIGTYSVRGLVIRMGSSEVRITPVARFSIGSYVGDSLGASIRNGRVDMTDGQSRFMLYRKTETASEWLMVDDRDYRVRDLDRENFESAIQSLLT